MELTHDFSLATPVDNAWRVFNDLDALAPCFPGATITESGGDDFAGSIKIKFGPITLMYNGSGRYVERNDHARRIIIEATGDERRTGGAASATVTASFRADGEHTAVHVVTDLGLTGRPAQLGRGVIADVSDKLLNQFVQCISGRFSGDLSASGAVEPSEEAEAEQTIELGVVPEELDGELDDRVLAEEPAAETTPGAAAPSAPGRAQPRPLQSETAPHPRPRPAYTPPSDTSQPAFDALRVVVPPLVKRFGPALAGAGLLAAIAVGVYRQARRG